MVRHPRGFYYVQRSKNSSLNSDELRKLKKDLRITRKNNSKYRKMVSGTDYRLRLNNNQILQCAIRNGHVNTNFHKIQLHMPMYRRSRIKFHLNYGRYVLLGTSMHMKATKSTRLNSP